MRKVTRDDAASVVGPPETAAYRPSWGGMPAWWGFSGSSWLAFNLNQVDVMLDDPVVALGTNIIYTPIIRHEHQWQVLADSPEIQQFVDHCYRIFWQNSIRESLYCVRYGFAAGEALFDWDHNDRLDFTGTKPLHPLDVIWGKDPETGLYGGVIIKNNSSSTGRGLVPGELRGPSGPKPAKGLWYYYGDEFNNHFGRSRYRSAYPPWREKNGTDGTLDIIRMWYYKNAYSGLVIRHPEKIMNQAGRAPGIPARDMARQIAETLKTGGVAALPSTVDPKTGRDLWSVDWPRMNGSAEGLLDYKRVNDEDILRGLLIPDDVITGSGGFSGRKVSEDAFYTMEEDILHCITQRAFDPMVVKPLVNFNFGPGDKYQVMWNPMLPARQQADAQAQNGANGPRLGGGNPAAQQPTGLAQALLGGAQKEPLGPGGAEGDPQQMGLLDHSDGGSWASYAYKPQKIGLTDTAKEEIERQKSFRATKEKPAPYHHVSPERRGDHGHLADAAAVVAGTKPAAGIPWPKDGSEHADNLHSLLHEAIQKGHKVVVTGIPGRGGYDSNGHGSVYVGKPEHVDWLAKDDVDNQNGAHRRLGDDELQAIRGRLFGYPEEAVQEFIAAKQSGRGLYDPQTGQRLSISARPPVRFALEDGGPEQVAEGKALAAKHGHEYVRSEHDPEIPNSTFHYTKKGNDHFVHTPYSDKPRKIAPDKGGTGHDVLGAKPVPPQPAREDAAPDSGEMGPSESDLHGTEDDVPSEEELRDADKEESQPKAGKQPVPGTKKPAAPGKAAPKVKVADNPTHLQKVLKTQTPVVEKAIQDAKPNLSPETQHTIEQLEKNPKNPGESVQSGIPAAAAEVTAALTGKRAPSHVAPEGQGKPKGQQQRGLPGMTPADLKKRPVRQEKAGETPKAPYDYDRNQKELPFESADQPDFGPPDGDEEEEAAPPAKEPYKKPTPLAPEGKGKPRGERQRGLPGFSEKDLQKSPVRPEATGPSPEGSQLHDPDEPELPFFPKATEVPPEQNMMAMNPEDLESIKNIRPNPHKDSSGTESAPAPRSEAKPAVHHPFGSYVEFQDAYGKDPVKPIGPSNPAATLRGHVVDHGRHDFDYNKVHVQMDDGTLRKMPENHPMRSLTESSHEETAPAIAGHSAESQSPQVSFPTKTFNQEDVPPPPDPHHKIPRVDPDIHLEDVDKLAEQGQAAIDYRKDRDKYNAEPGRMTPVAEDKKGTAPPNSPASTQDDQPDFGPPDGDEDELQGTHAQSPSRSPEELHKSVSQKLKSKEKLDADELAYYAQKFPKGEYLGKNADGKYVVRNVNPATGHGEYFHSSQVPDVAKAGHIDSEAPAAHSSSPMTPEQAQQALESKAKEAAAAGQMPEATDRILNDKGGAPKEPAKEEAKAPEPDKAAPKLPDGARIVSTQNGPDGKPAAHVVSVGGKEYIHHVGPGKLQGKFVEVNETAPGSGKHNAYEASDFEGGNVKADAKPDEADPYAAAKPLDHDAINHILGGAYRDDEKLLNDPSRSDDEIKKEVSLLEDALKHPAYSQDKHQKQILQRLKLRQRVLLGRQADANATKIQEDAKTATPEQKKDAEKAFNDGKKTLDDLSKGKGWGHGLKVLGLLLGSYLLLRSLRRHPGGLAIMLGLGALYLWHKHHASKDSGEEGEASSDDSAHEDAQKVADAMAQPGDPKVKVPKVKVHGTWNAPPGTHTSKAGSPIPESSYPEPEEAIPADAPATPAKPVAAPTTVSDPGSRKFESGKSHKEVFADIDAMFPEVPGFDKKKYETMREYLFHEREAGRHGLPLNEKEKLNRLFDEYLEAKEKSSDQKAHEYTDWQGEHYVEPPLEPGKLRYYHGAAGGGDPGDWLTPYRTYAEGYAAKGGGQGKTYYVDIPKDQLLTINAAWDKVNDNPVNFKAPAAWAKQLKAMPPASGAPGSGPGASSPAPPSTDPTPSAPAIPPITSSQVDADLPPVAGMHPDSHKRLKELALKYAEDPGAWTDQDRSEATDLLAMYRKHGGRLPGEADKAQPAAATAPHPAPDAGEGKPTGPAGRLKGARYRPGTLNLGGEAGAKSTAAHLKGYIHAYDDTELKDIAHDAAHHPDWSDRTPGQIGDDLRSIHKMATDELARRQGGAAAGQPAKMPVIPDAEALPPPKRAGTEDNNEADKSDDYEQWSAPRLHEEIKKYDLAAESGRLKGDLLKKYQAMKERLQEMMASGKFSLPWGQA